MTAAISAGAWLAAGAVVGSAAIDADAAGDASRAQRNSQQTAIDEQRRQFDLTRSDFAPYRTVGAGALDQLAQLYGLPRYSAPGTAAPLTFEEWSQQQPQRPSGRLAELVAGRVGGSSASPAAGNRRSQYDAYVAGFQPTDGGGRTFDNSGTGTPDYSAFRNSPDYAFNLSEGLSAVESGAAARGGLYSGNAMRALQERGAGIASQQYGNYTNRLAALAGVGQSATGSTGQLGAQMAGNVGNLLTAQGDARASSIAGSANAWGSAIGTLGSMGYDWYRNRNSQNFGGWGGTVGDS